MAGSPIEESWRSLCRAVRTADVAFVLGAGVSRNSGFPDWSQLVSDLTVAVGFEGRQTKELLRLQRNGMPWPTILSLIKFEFMKRRRTESAWQEAVRQVLYSKFRKDIGEDTLRKIRDCQRQNRANEKLAGLIRSRNPTLGQIVELSAVPQDDGGWKPSQHVAAILTYNLDEMLQVYDRLRHGSPRILRTIERASRPNYRKVVQKEQGKIPLFHLHGYLQISASGPDSEAAESLVLSEDEYHRRTDDPYNFATTSLLFYLQRATCIFVGCSMTDELMRRVLFRSKVELEKALVAERKGRQPTERQLLRHYAVVARSSSKNEMHYQEVLVERSLQLLGVRPLWVRRDYSDLPKRLEGLRQFIE